MNERPILFSPPMVRAILAGQKTQTRRVVKPQPMYDGLPVTKISPLLDGADCHRTGEFMFHHPQYDRVVTSGHWSPYGKPHDRLWIKEGWRPEVMHSHGMNTCDCGDVSIKYLADGTERFFEDAKIPNGWTMPRAAAKGSVTSLFMPRWASRITLEITGVRMERVQSISEEDAVAEGVHAELDWTACMKYAVLWNKINGARSGCAWADNPFVWVVEFRREVMERKAA